MNSPATSIFDQACELISAQIGALESPDDMTPEQLLEFQGRSEELRLICEQLEQREITLAEEQQLETVELLESVA